VNRDRPNSDQATCYAPSVVFSFSKRPGPLWGPPSLVFNGNWGLFTALGESDRAANVTTHFHIVPRLRASGVLPLFPLHAFMTCPETLSHVRSSPQFLLFPRIDTATLISTFLSTLRCTRTNSLPTHPAALSATNNAGIPQASSKQPHQ